MKKRYVAGNWKMNTNTESAVALAKELLGLLKDTDARVMIAPPFTVLYKISDMLKGSNIILGAQNCSDALSGAYTGEISAEMLKDVGVDTVILGHSERRTIYGEKNVFINKKIKTAIDAGLNVILCVGETLEEREAKEAELVVDKQLVGGLDGVSVKQLSSVTIAYEPVWAIGTGKTATATDANDMHRMIRNRIQELYGAETATHLTIQYGGSVKPENAKELLSQEHIDGALVGGASLKADSFAAIVKA